MPSLHGYDAIICHWLGILPSDEEDTFTMQAAQALWLESRFYENWVKILSKLLG